MKKKFIFLLISAMLMLTACAGTGNTVGSDNRAAENDSEAADQSTAAEETLNKAEAPQNRIDAEKEYEYLRSLEDLELDRDKIKQTEGKELSNIDFTECSVAVLSPYSEKIIEHLSEEDVKYFIDCIAETDTSSEEYEVPKTNGGSSFSFQITLKTGEQIYIGTSANDLLVINMEHGYMCSEESIDKIRKFYDEVYERFSEKAQY